MRPRPRAIITFQTFCLRKFLKLGEIPKKKTVPLWTKTKSAQQLSERLETCRSVIGCFGSYGIPNNIKICFYAISWERWLERSALISATSRPPVNTVVEETRVRGEKRKQVTWQWLPDVFLCSSFSCFIESILQFLIKGSFWEHSAHKEELAIGWRRSHSEELQIAQPTPYVTGKKYTYSLSLSGQYSTISGYAVAQLLRHWATDERSEVRFQIGSFT